MMVKINMADKEFIPCNLCNNDKFKLLYTKKHDNMEYRIVKCKSCGLICMNPRLTEEKNKELYGNLYYYFDRESDKMNINKAVEQFKIVELYSAKTRGKLLEIGCAKGFFLKIARDNGWETQGIDISDYACKYARERFGLNVIEGTLEDIDLPEKCFDLITLWDTVEHFRDPQKALGKIKRLLKDDGMLVIETPNINSVFFKLYRRYWLGFNPFHLYYFSPRTLGSMLSKLGFSIVNSDTMIVSLFSIEGIWERGLKTPIAEISSFLHMKERIKKVVRSLKPSRPEVILKRNRLIDLINCPTDSLLNKLKMGDHLLVVAKN